MPTGKQKLEERLSGASLVLAEVDAILAATGRAYVNAERSGHTSLAGEVAAIRRAARAAKQKATTVSSSLRERIAEFDVCASIEPAP